MKLSKYINIFSLAFGMLVKNVHSQETDQMAIKVSYNLLKLEYNHNLFSRNIHAGFSFGLGSKRSITELSDLHGEIQTKLPVFIRKHSDVLFNIYGGICHNEEAGLFPVLGTELEYDFKIGQKRNHALILCSGIIYGKKLYDKKYENQYVKVLSEEKYSLPFFYIIVGYGYRFLK